MQRSISPPVERDPSLRSELALNARERGDTEGKPERGSTVILELIAIGYWQVCQALKLSEIKRTRWMFWIITYGLALGAAAHATIIIIIVMVQPGIDSSLRTLDILQTYVTIPFGLFFLCYLIISTWFFVVVLSRHTLYPKWMAFLNPFLLSIVIALLHVSNIVPIIDNYLAPAYLSIPHLLFFTLSTLVLWNPKKM